MSLNIRVIRVVFIESNLNLSGDTLNLTVWHLKNEFEIKL